MQGITLVALQSKNHNVEVKTGQEKNKITHCATFSVENKPIPKWTKHSDTECFQPVKPHKSQRLGKVIRTREDNQPLKTKQKPSNSTNKDNKEPLWLLAPRMTNNTMTSTLL